MTLFEAICEAEQQGLIACGEFPSPLDSVVLLDGTCGIVSTVNDGSETLTIRGLPGVVPWAGCKWFRGKESTIQGGRR